MLDTKKLKELLTKATPGPWHRQRKYSYLPMSRRAWHDATIVDYLVELNNVLPELLRQLEVYEKLLEYVKAISRAGSHVADNSHISSAVLECEEALKQ